MLTSTDYDHTIRPREGTKISFSFDSNSFIRFDLDI